MSADTLLGPIPGAEHRDFAGVSIDVVRIGKARVKRSIYPVGFHWARDIKPKVGTETCEHAHVGFLARGRIHMTFQDGCQEVPSGPGLGVEIDEDKLAKLAENFQRRNSLARDDVTEMRKRDPFWLPIKPRW